MTIAIEKIMKITIDHFKGFIFIGNFDMRVRDLREMLQCVLMNNFRIFMKSILEAHF